VVLDNPLRPETKPPDDMEKAYEPSSERLIVMGRRFDTRSNLPWTLGSWTTEGIVRGSEGYEGSQRRWNEGAQLCLRRRGSRESLSSTDGYSRWWSDAILRKGTEG